MPVFTAQYLQQIGSAIFRACGAPPEEAALVADQLVQANLVGLDSHGIIRCIWYTQEVRRGHIRPGASIRIARETSTTAIVDCGYNFGPVGAARMVEWVAEKASSSHLACAVSQHCHHVGRLGAYVQQLAERGLIGLATVNSPKSGHFVVPWGGREGRLAANPLAYGMPTRSDPIVLDMSTSMISEGKLRVLMHENKPVPSGRILDAEGHPTTDPRAFYGPPQGAILPFGSELGYKGFGLGLLVEIMGGTLAGEEISDEYHYTNGLWLLALDPEAFCGRERFQQLIEELGHYITSTTPAPGFAQVLMPGELSWQTRDKRLREGVPVDAETWRQLEETARSLGVSLAEEK